jgi:alpha-L-rhamnosidase
VTTTHETSAAAPSTGRGGGSAVAPAEGPDVGSGVRSLPAAIDLRVERRTDPIGLDEASPRLSWRHLLDPGASSQSSAEIQVGTDPSFDPAVLVWSREVLGAESLIAYDGPAVGSREQRFWRVRITDDLGRPGRWSEPSSWEMGLLDPDDWVGRWIGWIDPAGASWSSRSPLLRRSFRVARRPRKARLYASALGFVELRINGAVVGDDRMAPGWTDYRQRIQYRAVDVAEFLRPGENVVAARLGRGWFAGEIASFGAEQYGDVPALLVQLEVEVAGGRRIVIATDASWRANAGPLVSDDLLFGETIDARDEPTGWLEPGFSDDDWHSVTLRAGPGGRLVAARDPGVRVVAELPARTITTIEPGRVVVDVGQNLAGHLRIRAPQPAGTTVTIRHAEVLDDAGELYVANLRSAKQTDRYTYRGDADETVEPRFTSHGFRYAEVSGITGALDPGEVTAVAVSSMGPEIGSFACSDDLVNAIHRNVVWGIRGNLVGLPTDCPQRDERLGWTADAAAFAPSALFLGGDAAALFERWLIDLEDAQLPSGAYSDVAPRVGITGSGNTGWADAGILVPLAVYRHTGDRRVLERQYESMRRYVRFLAADHADGIRHGGRYGDWLALEGPTSMELLGTAYLAHAARSFARIAHLLARDDDGADADALATRATAAFRRRFLTPTGSLVQETQAAYALAIAFDLVPRRGRRAAADRLAALIDAAGGHLLTGFLGTTLVLDVLSDHGHHELATRLVREDTFPSWGFQVRNGATTIWERWNGWTPEHGFADPGMTSFNHAAFGCVAEWLHERLAGLAPRDPGYRTMLVRPQPGDGIEWARASHESAHGRHAVEWSTNGGRLEIALEVPPNTFADVVPPVGSRAVRVDGRRRGAVRPVRVAWGRHVVEIDR